MEPLRIKRGGIQDSTKGINYQLNVLKLYTLYAYNKEKPFKCWTEDERADKFDDVCVQMIGSSGNPEYNFVQNKQKSNPSAIDYKSLFTDKDYELKKYFQSMLEIVENFSIEDCMGSIIITTNNSIKLNPSQNSDILTLSGQNTEFPLYFERITDLDDSVFQKCGKHLKVFKSHSNMKYENLASLHAIFLAIDLANFLFWEGRGTKQQNLFMLENSGYFLRSKVFSVKRTNIEITFEDAGFRSVFEYVVQQDYVKIPRFKKEKMLNNFSDFMKKVESNLSDSQKSKILNFQTDNVQKIHYISLFLEKFLIVSEVSEINIATGIKFELQKIFGGSNDSIFIDFDYRFNEWFLNDIHRPLNYEKTDEIIHCIKLSNRPGKTSLLKRVKDLLSRVGHKLEVDFFLDLPNKGYFHFIKILLLVFLLLFFEGILNSLFIISLVKGFTMLWLSDSIKKFKNTRKNSFLTNVFNFIIIVFFILYLCILYVIIWKVLTLFSSFNI